MKYTLRLGGAFLLGIIALILTIILFVVFLPFILIFAGGLLVIVAFIVILAIIWAVLYVITKFGTVVYYLFKPMQESKKSYTITKTKEAGMRQKG